MSSQGCAALIMAGGQSSRMRRGGSPVHKALRRVADAPLIEWNLAGLLETGFRDVYVAISENETELANWYAEVGVARAQRAGAQCSLIVEAVPLGTAGALSRLPKSVAHALVINVDNLTDLPLADVVAYHVRLGAAATLAVHRETFRMPFGQIEISAGRVTAYQEKPLLPVQVSSGTSVFARAAIDCVTDGQATQIPQLVQQLLKDGRLVAAFEHQSRWVDVNDETALAGAAAMLLDDEKPWPYMAGRSVSLA